MPTETMPKEALTQIETEKLDIERKLAEYGISKEFVEKYGLELAEYYCQQKLDVKVLAEKYGSKHRKHYPFPELENSPINRVCYAQGIEDEGGIYIRRYTRRCKDGFHYHLRPSVEYSNTSKELAEKASSWMSKKLPNPHVSKNPAHAPGYHIRRESTPAIDLVYLMRPFLTKKENVENADKIITMLKERPSIRCDENWNPIPVPEPKYITAFKLHQQGMSLKEIAQKIESSLTSVSVLIYHAKNQEAVRKRRREYYLKKKL